MSPSGPLPVTKPEKRDLITYKNYNVQNIPQTNYSIHHTSKEEPSQRQLLDQNRSILKHHPSYYCWYALPSDKREYPQFNKHKYFPRRSAPCR